MYCPRCLLDNQSNRTEVLETRAETQRDLGSRVRRRRRCDTCDFRFSTFERAQPVAVQTQAGTGPFDEVRLYESLRAAGDGTDVEPAQLWAIVERVRSEAEARDGSVGVDDIARWTLEKLHPHRELRAKYRGLMDYRTDESEDGQVEKRAKRGRKGRVETFDRQKLRAALEVAVHRRVENDDLTKVVDNIADKVAEADSPVPTAKIRKWIADELRKLDPFAYLRVLSTEPDADLGSLRQELVAVQHGLVRKTDGLLEPFSREKLIRGINRATVKRNTVSEGEIEAFAETIGDRVRDRSEPVESAQIGEWVLKWLKEKDEVAFMSFLLVFRPTDSPQSFLRTLDEDWHLVE